MRAQLMQCGRQVGGVRAGDSVLMPSGTAQCQVGSGSSEGAGADGSSEWHLAALTLVLGVCEASDVESDSESSAGSSVDQVVVDCSAAQQVRHPARGLRAAGRVRSYVPPVTITMRLEHIEHKTEAPDSKRVGVRVMV